MKMKTSIADTPISTEDAARLIGRTSRWVNLLFQKGYIKKNKDGLYTAAAVVEGYVKNIMEDKRHSAHSTAVADLAATKARIAAMNEARLKGDLVPTQAILDHAAETIGPFMSALSGLPAQFTRDRAERRRLEEMLNKIRNDYARTLRAKSEQLKKGEQ
jgi:hypothetical protein